MDPDSGKSSHCHFSLECEERELLLFAGLVDTYHVLEYPRKTLYNAVLGMVDVMKGTNSYYKLQLLESDSGGHYQLFRAWGRVGTTIGGNKLEVCLPC